jgi:hypothetical protein
MTRKLVLALICLVLLLGLLIRASSGAMPNPFLDYQNLGLWVGAALTLFALSFLYGDNPFFRFTEHVFVGVASAYWMVQGFWGTIVPKLLANLAPEITDSLFGMDFPLGVPWTRRLFYALPLLMSGMLLTRLHPRARRAGTWTLAFLVGTTAGLRLIAFLDAGFMTQIQNSVISLVAVSRSGFDLGRTLNAILLTGGVICCLLYFFFSRRETGPVAIAGRFGLAILMVTFGASFGFSVMGRVAVLVGRMEFLLRDWLGII